MTLTFSYFTSRKNPLIEHFFSSLHRETGGDYTDIKVVIVDFWMNQPESGARLESWRPHLERIGDYHVCPPKPNVWQGPHRLTAQDWWAASSARNTAICLAPDGWIVFVDDLSVLMPGYMSRIREAMTKPHTITCGSYRKVKNLVVDEVGNVVSFEDYPGGHDNRFQYGRDNEAIPCGGNWLYGCSLIAPVEAFLSIGGFPEAWCDGLSFEDVIAGIMLEKKGWKLQYDRSMMTYEDHDLHFFGPVMKRSDYGVSPNDKSHAVLNAAQQGDGWHPNYFGDEGIRGLRQRVLAGEPFPVMEHPEHEFFTATPLKDL